MAKQPPIPPVRNSGSPTRPARKGGEQAPRAGYRVGRKAGDPLDIRSARIVQRVHPDLVAVLEQRAREDGLTRSLFIERILIKSLNANYGARLDAIGRWQPIEGYDEREEVARRPPLRIGEQRQREHDELLTAMIETGLQSKSPGGRLPNLPPGALRKPVRKDDD